jgi:hypothetical protein
MPTLTNVIGTLYNANGGVLNVGKLYINLQQDIISVDGTKVAPTVIEVDLVATSGVVNVNLYATIGATPAGVSYRVQYDPDPADVTRPMHTKAGYWSNYWAVPNTASVSLGSFTPSLRGTPTANYLPITGTAASAGAAAGYITVLINGVPRKILYYAVS